MAKHIERKFYEYHKDNPKVYDLFVGFAKEVKAANRDTYSANSIFERIRWHVDIETVGEVFKLNNNYRAYYARKMMNEYPEFKTFFRLRELQDGG